MRALSDGFLLDNRSHYLYRLPKDFTLKKNKLLGIGIFPIIGFSIIIIGITVVMTLKNTNDMMGILENSIKSELISTSVAAREILDVDKFDSYNSVKDINNDLEAYKQTLRKLRHLQKQIGVTYIYALKLIDGKYHFIFDTDEESDTLFDEYAISPVHERAFLGEEFAGIMNVIDEFGNFNTGAVPVWKNGKVIGIISTDIEDKYIKESNKAANRNITVLMLTLSFAMCVMIVVVLLLSRNVQKMQDKLFRMANYDILTGLPNRQYLITYLTEIMEETIKKQTSFALLLIDLDNFKRVNDNAGHDAGDELLQHIAKYLESVHGNSKSFRPPAGALNVSARIGGDEFVQIIPGISTVDEARMAAKKLIDNFSSQAINRYVEKYQVGLSIGVALFPYHTENFNVLIKYADTAMYYAKRSGKNTYCVYNDEMNQTDSNKPSEKTE